MKAARLEYEAYLGDVREMVDTHVQGFQNRGYSREEALFFGGQLHVLLTQWRRHCQPLHTSYRTRAHTMSMNGNSDASSFFSQVSGGGGGAPSFAFQKLGDTVKGRVVSCKMMDQTYFGTSDKIPDGKGGYKKQLQVVLDTNLRNWEGLKKTPTDQD